MSFLDAVWTAFSPVHRHFLEKEIRPCFISCWSNEGFRDKLTLRRVLQVGVFY